MADTVPDRPALAEGALGLLRRRMTQLGSAQVARTSASICCSRPCSAGCRSCVTLPSHASCPDIPRVPRCTQAPGDQGGLTQTAGLSMGRSDSSGPHTLALLRSGPTPHVGAGGALPTGGGLPGSTAQLLADATMASAAGSSRGGAAAAASEHAASPAAEMVSRPDAEVGYARPYKRHRIAPSITAAQRAQLSCARASARLPSWVPCRAVSA